MNYLFQRQRLDDNGQDLHRGVGQLYPHLIKIVDILSFHFEFTSGRPFKIPVTCEKWINTWAINPVSIESIDI